MHLLAATAIADGLDLPAPAGLALLFRGFRPQTHDERDRVTREGWGHRLCFLILHGSIPPIGNIFTGLAPIPTGMAKKKKTTEELCPLCGGKLRNELVTHTEQDEQGHCLFRGGRKPSPLGEAFRGLAVHSGPWPSTAKAPIAFTRCTTIVFITKYRKPVLTGDIALRARALIREICRSEEVEILKGHIQPDHVHLLLSMAPQVSPSRIMQTIKGKASHHLLQEYRSLHREFWGRHLWARGYFVATSGNVTDEVLKQYIELQGAVPQDDRDFTISE